MQLALDFILKARFQTVVISTFQYNQKAHLTMRKSIPACLIRALFQTKTKQLRPMTTRVNSTMSHWELEADTRNRRAWENWTRVTKSWLVWFCIWSLNGWKENLESQIVNLPLWLPFSLLAHENLILHQNNNLFFIPEMHGPSRRFMFIVKKKQKYIGLTKSVLTLSFFKTN